MRRLLQFPLAVLACAALASAASAASPSPPFEPSPSPAPAGAPAGARQTVDVIKVDGIIDRPLAAYIEEQLDAAERAGHIAVLQIDSPGSLGVDPLALPERAGSLRVPVLAWIGGAGATAEGSAALLASRADLISVAPGAGFGPLAPLDLADPDAGTGPSGSPEPLESAVSRTLTAEEAIEAGIATELVPGDPSAQTVVDFVEQADGRTVEGVVLRTTVAEAPGEGPGVVIAFKSPGPIRSLLHSVANPTAIYVQLILGLAGLAFETTQPGFGFAGIGGVLALGFAAYGMWVIPPSWFGLAVLLLGNLLLIVDVRLRRLGVLSAAGMVAFVAGSFLLYGGVADSVDVPGWVIWMFAVAAALYYGFGLTVATQARDRIGQTQLALVGLTGEVRSDLNPVGGVVVKGTVWRAKTVGEHARAGTRVRVRGVDGMVLRVEPEPDEGD